MENFQYKVAQTEYFLEPKPTEKRPPRSYKKLLKITQTGSDQEKEEIIHHKEEFQQVIEPLIQNSTNQIQNRIFEVRGYDINVAIALAKFGREDVQRKIFDKYPNEPKIIAELIKNRLQGAHYSILYKHGHNFTIGKHLIQYADESTKNLYVSRMTGYGRIPSTTSIDILTLLTDKNSNYKHPFLLVHTLYYLFNHWEEIIKSPNLYKLLDNLVEMSTEFIEGRRITEFLLSYSTKLNAKQIIRLIELHQDEKEIQQKFKQTLYLFDSPAVDKYIIEHQLRDNLEIYLSSPYVETRKCLANHGLYLEELLNDGDPTVRKHVENIINPKNTIQNIIEKIQLTKPELSKPKQPLLLNPPRNMQNTPNKPNLLEKISKFFKT